MPIYAVWNILESLEVIFPLLCGVSGSRKAWFIFMSLILVKGLLVMWYMQHRCRPLSVTHRFSAPNQTCYYEEEPHHEYVHYDIALEFVGKTVT
jgi:hypothetical protein